MKRGFLLTALQIFSVVSFSQALTNLLCENKANPLGIDIARPRFSWRLNNDERKTMQTAYEIRVGEDEASLISDAPLWSSGRVASDSSVQVSYKGRPLQSGKKYFWQVRCWDNKGKAYPWSSTALWQMGLLQPSDWKASWIQAGYQEDTVTRPSPLLRKQFFSNKKIIAATAFITAHGLYEGFINGKRIGDSYLTPGWTSYHHRLQYQVYDVTSMVQMGSNAIGVMLGNGWYRGIIGYSNNINVYGKDASLLFQLQLEYDDGTMELVVSDGSWKSSTGAVLSSEIYNGELFDAGKEKEGWTLANYDDRNWDAVSLRDDPKDILLATCNEPVKKHETFQPVQVFTSPKGEKLIDFGQNLVGWVMLKIRGQKGDTVTIQHAEVLDKHGNFYTENLRAAAATDRYILRGDAEEFLEPHFTFHGFRYIKVQGVRGEIRPEQFTAVALYSDMPQIGRFSSSNTMINQLQHNIAWGQKGNFLDVPTDCPQRDERLGWTGDAQVFSRTASFNMNVNNFFAKWLKDVAADQLQNGAVPFVIPNILGKNAVAATGWADVATIVPWNVYLAYGDKRLLEDQYPSMKAWVEYMRRQSNDDLWNTGFHFGDWLSYMEDNDVMERSAITDKPMIAQCFWAYSTQLLINAATVLKRHKDVTEYTALLRRIKKAFLKEYVTPNGRLVSGTQTAYVLALNFDMLPVSLRQQAVDRLVKNIKSYDNHLSTGFLGTPYLCHVLSRFGRTDVAYQLLLQDTYPSWLYPVKMGATTIWERWNGMRPDSTFASASMNSFNHYAYGAIGDWMYRAVAGIDTYQDGAGYKHIRIQPQIRGGFTRVSASLDTYYGRLRNAWSIDGTKLLMDVEVPVNTRATVYIPGALEQITENGKALGHDKDVQVKGREGKFVVVEVGSGQYHFVSVNGVL